MANEIIVFDAKIEKLRLDLIDYIESKGSTQAFFCRKTGLSNCSISLFIASKRLLIPEKLKIIKDIIYSS